MKTPIELSFEASSTFAELFASMAEGVIMVDQTGSILLANHMAEEMFGYQPQSMMGTKMEALLPERFRGRHMDLRNQFSSDPRPRRMGVGRDLRAMRKDGSEFPVEISLSFTRKNEQLLVMAFVSDISARKRYEDDLKRSEEQLLLYASELEKKVQSRTEALNQSVVNLESEIKERKKAEEEVRKLLEKERELNELKSKFVSIASHEFRTPLSTILSSASLVNQYKDRGELDKITKHTQRIKSSVNHLTGILNDFLSLSKLEEGKLYVVNEALALEEFFNEVAEDMIPTLKEGQYIRSTGECNRATIYTDPRILRNILFNLISNASKYSESKPIHLFYECSDTEFTFRVRDEGMGIPNDDKKHIFTRFFRASNAGNVQGTGLGLNIVQRYVDLLGGTISFESEYEKGATFIVTLPI